MGCAFKLVKYSSAILVIFGAVIWLKISQVPEKPHLENTYWGPGSSKQDDVRIREFKINVSNAVLEDLKHRLTHVRPLTPPLEGIQQQYGFNTDLLKEVIQYWTRKYNWREREKFLNKYNQFKTQIQGLDIHFLHVKPTTKIRTVPLLILHGWPGSIREFYEIIPHLTTQRDGVDFAFEVIAPSLPGFGFSDAAAKPGLGDIQTAVLMNNLMKRLGHEKYYIQGGDWGSMIVKHMAVLFPDNILGLHSNLCVSTLPKTYLKILLGSLYPSLVIPKEFERKLYPLSQRFSDLLEESGYFHLQATKPDTIGAALGESPAGLAAYILEKFSTGTDLAFRSLADGGLLKKFTYDLLLDNIMIYWVTSTQTTAMRFYAESTNKKQLALGVSSIPIDPKVPCACSKFKNEIAYQPDSFLRDKYTNLVQSSEFNFGGHFIASEEPEIFAKDIFSAVVKMEKLRT